MQPQGRRKLPCDPLFPLTHAKCRTWSGLPWERQASADTWRGLGPGVEFIPCTVWRVTPRATETLRPLICNSVPEICLEKIIQTKGGKVCLQQQCRGCTNSENAQPSAGARSGRGAV